MSVISSMERTSASKHPRVDLARAEEEKLLVHSGHEAQEFFEDHIAEIFSTEGEAL